MARPKPEIELTKLLAIESTKEAQNLLKKHGIAKAKGYADLKNKLEQLYVQSDDKVAIEKEFAEIHPHRKWIIKNSEPEVQEKETVVEVEQKPETDNSKYGCGCGCGCGCRNRNSEIYSNFDSTSLNIAREATGISKSEFMIGAVALVSVVALTVVFASKNK